MSANLDDIITRQKNLTAEMKEFLAELKRKAKNPVVKEKLEKFIDENVDCEGQRKQGDNL